MRKNTLILFLAVFFWPVLSLTAQTQKHKLPKQDVCLSGEIQNQEPVLTLGARSLLVEDFSAGCPPAGWTIIGDGQSNWQSSSTNNAGGSPPEAMFSWTPNFTGNSKLASVPVNTEGMESLVLEFSHMVDDYSGDYTLKVETSADGTNWNVVWSENITGNIDPETLNLLIDNGDVGSAEFMIAFTYDGNSFNINQWYIDNVILAEALSNDAGIVSVSVPPLAPVNEVIEVEATAKNFGMQANSFDVLLEINDGSSVVFSDTKTVENLAGFATEEIVFTGWNAEIGTYDVSVSTQLAGDENPDNDLVSESMQVITEVFPRKPCFEEFTSSTCAPCATANPIIDQVLGDNPGQYSLVKYQMDWPGGGDPYYTEQGGVRRDYYGVNAVPTLYGNAVKIDPPASMSQQIFDDLAAGVTGLEIDLEATIDDDFVVTLNAGINSHADYPSGLKAHMVVVEKTTYGNVSTNGEESFNHVMMAMLPGAGGTELEEMNPGSQVSLSESYDMTETFMEQPNDLAAIVFIQDDTDKSVLQSQMVDVTGTFTTYSVTFNVEDSEGSPVEDAIVNFDINGPETTNADGQAIFETVFPGVFDYEVEKSGLLPATGNVEVIDENVTVDVVLEIPDYYFFEDFNGGLPGDWTKYISSGNTNNLYWYDGFMVFWMQNAGDEHIMLITPEINLTQAGTLFFEAGDIYSTPGISVGTVDDPENPDSYEELANFSLTAAWEEYAVVLEEMNVTDSYLAFKYDGPPQGYFYFDNVKISVSTTALAVPTDLTATVEDNDVLLEWTAPEIKGLLGYNIYRDDVNIGYAEETSYTDADLENGFYTYYVTAVYDEGESGASNTATANVGNVLVYCDAWGGCDQYISNVEFGSIDNSSDCTEYGDYTDLSTLLDPGETYTLSVSIASPSTGDDVGVWIDFNQDGEFSEEENLVCEMNNNQGNFEFDISVPSDAVPGSTRMRLRVKYWGETCDPCGSSTWGETEDYSVEISDPTGVYSANANSLQVFPNPADHIISIECKEQITEYWIYGYAGQIVRSEKLNTTSASLDVAALKPGIYFLRIKTDQKIWVEQIIIE